MLSSFCTAFLEQRKLLLAGAMTFILVIAAQIPSLIGKAYLNLGALSLNRAALHSPQYLEKSIAQLTRSTHWVPCSSYERLGWAYLIQHDYHAAGKAFERSVQQCDTRSLAWLGLGQAYLHLGKRQEAIIQWAKLKGVSHYFYNCGYRNRIEKNFADSELCLSLALELEPDFPKVYLELGHLYREQGNISQAVAMYQRAVDLMPDSARAYYYLGLAYRDAGRWQEAIATFHTAIQTDPEYLEAYLQLGHAYWKLGKHQTAVEWYSTARSVDPDSERPNLFLGQAALQQGNLDQASEYLHLAFSQNPQSAQVCYQLGRLYYHLGQTKSAVEQFRRAVDLDPRLVAAWQDLIQTLIEQEHYQEAMSELQQVLSMYPNDPTLQSQLHTLQTLQGKNH